MLPGVLVVGGSVYGKSRGRAGGFAGVKEGTQMSPRPENALRPACFEPFQAAAGDSSEVLMSTGKLRPGVALERRFGQIVVCDKCGGLLGE